MQELSDKWRAAPCRRTELMPNFKRSTGKRYSRWGFLAGKNTLEGTEAPVKRGGAKKGKGTRLDGGEDISAYFKENKMER